jgi:hypothetical protein
MPIKIVFETKASIKIVMANKSGDIYSQYPNKIGQVSVRLSCHKILYLIYVVLVDSLNMGELQYLGMQGLSIGDFIL